MKKILFGFATAIFAAVGFTSFKSATSVNTYWFSTITNYPKGTIPSAVANVSIMHPNISVEVLGVKPGPSIGPCAGSNYVCLVAFTTAQLTVTHLAYLRTSALRPSLPAYSAAYTK